MASLLVLSRDLPHLLTTTEVGTTTPETSRVTAGLCVAQGNALSYSVMEDSDESLPCAHHPCALGSSTTQAGVAPALKPHTGPVLSIEAFAWTRPPSLTAIVELLLVEGLAASREL